MALGFTALDSAEETSTDNTMTSASISPPDGAVLYVTTIGTDSSIIELGSGSVSGLGGTWVELAPTGGVVYGARRLINVYRGTKATAWGTGTLTIVTSVEAAQDMAYIIDQVTGADDTTPNDTPVTKAVATGNLTHDDVGTVDAGDAVYVVAGLENSSASLACTGYTQLNTLDSLSNVRQIRSWYDDTSPDETPNVTRSGNADLGSYAFVINVGSAPPASVVLGRPFVGPFGGPLVGPLG